MALNYRDTRAAAQRLILASSSPRRAELLRLLTEDFVVVPPETEEGEIRFPGDLLVAAQKKAEAVRKMVSGGIVIGADTGVFRNSRHFGKPVDHAAAREMLRSLSSGWHSVVTGLCVFSTGRRVALVETRVRFKELSPAEIDWYVEREEVRDKAGAYAIQGRAALFAERIEGEFTNVMGLPVATLYRLLLELGWRPQ